MAKREEPIVARVNGIPVPLSRLKRALKEKRLQKLGPRGALQVLTVEEAVAQVAARYQKYVPNKFRYLKLLAIAYLAHKLGEDFLEGGVPQRYFDDLLKMRVVRVRLDHLAIYRVKDFSWICCDGRPEHCEKVDPCFKEGRAAIDAVYQFLRDFKPQLEDVPLLLPDLQKSAPQLRLQEYEFAYDPVKKLQKGSRIFDDHVVQATVALEVGEFSRPVRSAYGWHVLFLAKYMPPEHLKPDSRKAHEILLDAFGTLFQRRALGELLAKLIPVRQFEYLKTLYKGKFPLDRPAYRVELYPERLDEVFATKNDLQR